MARLMLLMLVGMLLAGCKQNTTPVPLQMNGESLYQHYRKQNRGYPLSAKEANAVLVRTDLKSTGDYAPSDGKGDGAYIRFLYGRKYYWAYHNNPGNFRYEAKMYGPFEMPR